MDLPDFAIEAKGLVKTYAATKTTPEMQALRGIDLAVPRGANCLSFDFRFLSEEFPEFVHDLYNDAFIAEVGRSDWDASSKTDPTISAPRIRSAPRRVTRRSSVPAINDSRNAASSRRCAGGRVEKSATVSAAMQASR